MTLFTRSLCNLILNYYSDSYSVLNVLYYVFSVNKGGGMMSLVCGSLFSSFMAFIVYIVWSGDCELSFRFTVLLLCVIYWFFTVISKPFMSGVNIDEPGFTAPAGSAPPSSDSSADPPPECRKKCVSCPRRMSAKTADRHTVCVHCRGFDCNFDTRCDECIDWPEEELRLYAKMRKSLKTKDSSRRRDKTPAPSPPPPATSVPPSQPDALSLMQCQVDTLNVMLNSMSETFLSRLDSLQASIGSSLPDSSNRPSHRPDGGASQPGVTTDESRTFQAMGEPSRKSRKSFSYDQDRPPCQEFAFPSAASQPREPPRAEP